MLVALNSVFQIVAFAGLGYFYLELLPGWLQLDQTDLDVSIWVIAKAVLIFLGIPLLAGFLTRTVGERLRGRDWYEGTLLPRIGPVALYGLLFTIVVLFALQGDSITRQPFDVVRIALPLLAYFALMFGGSFWLGHRLGLGYPRTSTLAFTASGNNFELAIAVCIGVFGATSGQALAGVVGPLTEVPVLVALVYVALWLRRRSAGSQPGGSLNTAVVQVLHERGLSTEGERPKLLTLDGVQEADVVITMGCGETCPVAPGKRYEDWELDDPKDRDLETVRRIVDEIDARVRALLADLDATSGPAAAAG